jgi:hypothetical protein
MDEDMNNIQKPPVVGDIYSTARSFFNAFGSGSPLIAKVHEDMWTAKNPMLNKPASFTTGWEAGVLETQELKKLPHSNDWRDKFARHDLASMLRPPAAALTGAMMKSSFDREQVNRDPSRYSSSNDPFSPYF